MALTPEKKLYIALGVLAALGGVLFLQNKKASEEATAYSLEGRAAELPKIVLTEEVTRAIDRIAITQAPGDGGAGSEIVLEKKGEEWRVTKPVAAKANDGNVKSLLDNVKTLKVTDAIDTASDTATYDKWKVSDGKALHAVFNKGKDVVADFYFGEDGTRGQVTRIAGKNGVYAVKGYSSFLFARDVKGWRDLTLFKFDSEKVKSVAVQNEHGRFSFAKDKGTWVAKYGKGRAEPTAKLDRFDENRLKDLLRAYENLNADGFADGKSAAETGVDQPSATISFLLEDGARREVALGKVAEGSGRWAKVSDYPELVSISTFAADWATGDASKFQKPKDGGASLPAADQPPGPPPGGVPLMMGGNPHEH